MKNWLLSLSCRVLIACLFGGGLGRAEELVAYQFLAGDPEPTTKAAGVEASPVTDPKPDGPRMPDYIGVTSNGQIYWDAALLKDTFDGPEGSAAARQYAEFTIQPAPGKSLSLESLEFDYGGNAPSDGSYGAGVRVVCSEDNYHDILGEEEFTVDYSGDLKAWVPSGQAIVDLSKQPGLRALKGPVTFRIYARDDYAGGLEVGKVCVRVSNLVIKGRTGN